MWAFCFLFLVLPLPLDVERGAAEGQKVVLFGLFGTKAWCLVIYFIFLRLQYLLAHNKLNGPLAAFDRLENVGLNVVARKMFVCCRRRCCSFREQCPEMHGLPIHLQRAQTNPTVSIRKMYCLPFPSPNDRRPKVSAVAFDTDGLTMGVGTSSAHCLTFDLRSSRPTFVKEHQYGLPITGVKFHQVKYTVWRWSFGFGALGWVVTAF